MTTATEPASTIFTGELPTQGRSSAFRNFAIVWALASLFHMAHSGLFDTRLNFALLSIAALHVLFKPRLYGIIALALLQLVDVAFQMPNVTNHWLFTAFVNLTILQSVLYCVYTRKTFRIDEADFYNTFAPVARVEVLILYVWAIFHKLNSGFFSPEVSCASTLLKAQNLDFMISAFPQIISFNAYFSLLVELGILVMLCFGKTRNAAVLIGFIFHVVLSYSSYNAFFDFTSMVIAVYVLFTNEGFNRRAEQWRINSRQSVKSFFNKYSVRRLLIVVVLVAILIGLISILNKQLNSFEAFHLHFFWTLYVVILAFVLTRFLFVKKTHANGNKPFALKNAWFLILPVVVFLNGTSPYLGLKTENSYSMFSNLRTEGGVTNHLIVPAGLQIFGYQSDIVEIESSTDESLQRLADQGQLLVLFEFKRYLKKHSVDEVVYRLNGKRNVFREGETKMAGALEPDSWLLLRIMKFRTFSKNEPQPCAH